MTGYAGYRPSDDGYNVAVYGASINMVYTVDQAKDLIYDLEHAVACAETGTEIAMCTCGHRPYLFEPEPNAGVWKVKCSYCRRVTNGWASKPEAVRMWNRMVEDILLRKGPGIHRLMYANRTIIGFVPECLYTTTNGLYVNPTEPTNCLSRRLNKSGSMRLMETIEDGSKAQIVLEDISPRDADAIHAFQLAGGKGRLVISESGITYEG